MKIAYIVLAHTDPEHIARLAKKLVKGTQHAVFLHLDQKSAIEPFRALLKDEARVHFVEPRIKAYWGGYSLVEATINAFRQARQHGGFDRFVVLQGLEYPIRSNREIEGFFNEHPDTEFMRARNETLTRDTNDLKKYRLRWSMDRDKRSWRLVNAGNILISKLGRLIRFKKPTVKVGNARLTIYRGWGHFALTGRAIDYILDFHDSYLEFNRFFMHVYAPDESYFHTILYNSPFINQTPDKGPTDDISLDALLNLTYCEYPDQVTIFTQKADYPTLEQSGCLFFRKATSESRELLDHIDSVHHRER
ncbi:beta-1,6-N-acetylglucosaminyltransferase [Halomonas sp. MA07-2]|uniref:beta-1,6-N-acetylglucosaminyltransferase n=1 Tax=Halomonas sp. MA07-2 TaxID=3440841 RepID=UPI003EE91AB8